MPLGARMPWKAHPLPATLRMHPPIELLWRLGCDAPGVPTDAVLLHGQPPSCAVQRALWKRRPGPAADEHAAVSGTQGVTGRA